MKAALIGLPQSGKSTLFSAITGLTVDAFAAPEPRLATVKVPEPRLAHLVALYTPRKVVEATMEFVDVPGCALDDAKGQEEWRRLLPAVRQADVLVVVVRGFENGSVAAYRNRVDPSDDFSEVWNELIFADLDATTTRIHRIESALKKPTKTHDLEKRELTFLQRCRETLETGTPLSQLVQSEEEHRQVASFSFLSQKPIVCVFNVGDDDLTATEGPMLDHLASSLRVCAPIEAEIARLDQADRGAFLNDLGLPEPARDRLIRACYSAGGLISFLTMGPDEARAWTIPAGSTAVEAAARIHTDLARGFVRAETVSYADLVAHHDLKGARAAGKVRKEGKGYVVADGDILNILSSV